MRNSDKFKKELTGFTAHLTVNEHNMIECLYTNCDTEESSMIYAKNISDLIIKMGKDRRAMFQHSLQQS